MEYTLVNGQVIDENKNRATISRWGSEEKAREALESNSDCSDCSDCSGCDGCDDCSRCSYCSDCSRCDGCDGCDDCSGCYGCYGCSDCSRCSRCSDCSRCYGCYGCSDCDGCDDCSGCYGCSDCSGCDDYSERRSFVENSKGVLAIPVIADIHQAVLSALESGQRHLSMKTWHTCETTHCRAGLVVDLAGSAGYELERKTSPLFAAMQIYKASGHPISPCRFFDSDDDAMAHIRECAAE